ncbi:MAG TPA: glucose-1-phosphate cytidylyltransferase [Planctomycetaceae bacterium]|nr:glucose-1-phosphate cytidylyltransferase [Planctomycetaceae bacterium]
MSLQVVILAGGLGTRLSEETVVKPKPMVEVGGEPILWHIMKHYAHYSFREFFVALGYRGDFIKRYFLEYYTLYGSMSVNLGTGHVAVQQKACEDWLVHLRETGQDTNTGGRLKALQPHLRDGTFMLTYGDGVSNVDLPRLLEFHRQHGRIATVTAVRPPARFGGLVIEGDLVARFTEKPQTGEGWINGGFFVFEPGIFDYLHGPECSLESFALEALADDRELAAYKHDGFWQCMDTLRDKNYLENLWQQGTAPWRVWTDRSPRQGAPLSGSPPPPHFQQARARRQSRTDAGGAS